MNIYEGVTVQVINPQNVWFNKFGVVWNRGNGNNWQVELIRGCGIYVDQKDLKVVKNKNVANY